MNQQGYIDYGQRGITSGPNRNVASSSNTRDVIPTRLQSVAPTRTRSQAIAQTRTQNATTTRFTSSVASSSRQQFAPAESDTGINLANVFGRERAPVIARAIRHTSHVSLGVICADENVDLSELTADDHTFVNVESLLNHCLIEDENKNKRAKEVTYRYSIYRQDEISSEIPAWISGDINSKYSPSGFAQLWTTYFHLSCTQITDVTTYHVFVQSDDNDTIYSFEIRLAINKPIQCLPLNVNGVVYGRGSDYGVSFTNVGNEYQLSVVNNLPQVKDVIVMNATNHQFVVNIPGYDSINEFVNYAEGITRQTQRSIATAVSVIGPSNTEAYKAQQVSSTFVGIANTSKRHLTSFDDQRTIFNSNQPSSSRNERFSIGEDKGSVTLPFLQGSSKTIFAFLGILSVIVVTLMIFGGAYAYWFGGPRYR